MKKRILAYLAYIDGLLESDEERDWEKEIKLHLDQIGFFMHERLVHLLVFILVAVCTVMYCWFPTACIIICWKTVCSGCISNMTK